MTTTAPLTDGIAMPTNPAHIAADLVARPRQRA
jgi:hypothetical protein